jgi:hypothetical protein
MSFYLTAISLFQIYYTVSCVSRPASRHCPLMPSLPITLICRLFKISIIFSWRLENQLRHIPLSFILLTSYLNHFSTKLDGDLSYLEKMAKTRGGNQKTEISVRRLNAASNNPADDPLVASTLVDLRSLSIASICSPAPERCATRAQAACKTR